MDEPTLDDALAADPVERLLEDSWEHRARRAASRELLAEATAAALFLALAVPLAVATGALQRTGIVEAAAFVALYAFVSRMIKFPLGAGYVVPSYLVLVPMLLVLPLGAVPLLAAAGLVVGTLAQYALRQVPAERVVFAIPDAWHALGPTLVLMAFGRSGHGAALAGIYVLAFVAGCVVDLLSSMLREAAALGIAPDLQLRVVAVVWLVDAGIAPLGVLVTHAARNRPAEALLVAPVALLLLLLVRDRNTRIAEAQHRLDLIAYERTRLQAAVRRLGDAFGAKLDLDALADIVLRGSVEALGASAGRLALAAPDSPRVIDVADAEGLHGALDAAAALATGATRAHQVQVDGAWALALPFGRRVGDQVHGSLTVARADRAFREDEEALMARLVERACGAAEDIVANQSLREQAVLDPLTKLGNRRKLATDLDERLRVASADAPLILVLFDLDGFKAYNDTFGHPAGDALLMRLGTRLRAAVASFGAAYRLGGDEFCALMSVGAQDFHAALTAATVALEEHGEEFSIGASCGAVLIPQEASSADSALQLADERMYAHKNGRASAAGQQTRDILVRIMQTREPQLHEDCSEVADLAVRIGRRLGMTAEELADTARAAELHDIGKVGVPEAILEKPGPLDAAEWGLVRQHTLLGERILNAAPVLRSVALTVRATHERWDGRGYPDAIAGEEIPLAARIIGVCDAYRAMTTFRAYREELTHEQACAELQREAGHQFDPRVITAFLAEAGSGAVLEPRPETPVRDERRRAVDELAAHLNAVLGGT